MDHCMKLTKTLFTTFLGASIFAFPSATWANTVEEQFQQGLAAAEKGDHQTAFQFWKPLAEQGYASAQFNLGVIYDHEQGVEQDYIEAAKWYRKAAEQGHRDAQFNLGVMFSHLMIVAEELWLDLDLIRLEDISHKNFSNCDYVMSAVLRT